MRLEHRTLSGISPPLVCGVSQRMCSPWMSMACGLQAARVFLPQGDTVTTCVTVLTRMFSTALCPQGAAFPAPASCPEGLAQQSVDRTTTPGPGLPMQVRTEMLKPGACLGWPLAPGITGTKIALFYEYKHGDVRRMAISTLWRYTEQEPRQ